MTSNTLDMAGSGSAANSLGDTVSSVGSNITAVPQVGSELSASGISKIDRSFQTTEIKLTQPSRLVVITKWLVTFINGALFLGCLVSSKLSAIGVAAKLQDDGNCITDQESAIPKEECCTSFIHILLMLLIPNVLTFLRFSWSSIGRSDRKWPTGRRLFMCVLVSALETFGLCLFALKILKFEKSAVVILLMDGIYFVHAVTSAIFTDGNVQHSSRLRLAYILGAVSTFCGLGLTVYVIIDKNYIKSKDIWQVFVSLLCLGLAWLPWIRRRFILVDKMISFNGFIPDMTFQKTGSGDQFLKSPNSMSGASSVSSSQQFSLNYDREEKYTHKLIVVSSFVKILLTFIFCFLIQDVMSGNISSVIDEWSNGWNFSLQDFSDKIDQQTYFFMINAISTTFGYAVGVYALQTQMVKGAFVIPLLLVTPLSFVILYVHGSCSKFYFGDRTIPFDDGICNVGEESKEFLIPAMMLLWIGQCLTVGYYVFKSNTIVLQKEVKLFWLPMFNSFMSDQWMLLDRRTMFMDAKQDVQEEQIKKTKVYICTTMYRETRDEMKQLLESIAHINAAKQIGTRFFESHIIFDGGIKGNAITNKALQLLGLVPEVLKCGDVDTCTMADFPYGLRLSWRLHSSRGENCGQPMTFVIHLKDNRKVKNKKRWSQIMYMSYILDFLVREDSKVDDETAFILTTDADVKFTPDSVEALLDLMTRDTSVGAVCARTYPQGFGPLYWYQQFEYAIGHWFQKAAEHVLGSVLCAPGCFSVYRVKALRDIIPTYASNVEKGMEFLTKDMGEDRWLCTLMVQSGWRIDYCAASANYTNCPTEFNEFYTQRRRWIGSTVANLYLLLKEASILRKLNQGISFGFLIYQGLLLVSTVLGPSTVTLIISGGLAYAWNLDVTATVIAQFAVIVAFGLVCIKASQKIQLLTAKILSFAYALVMMAVVVGTAEQLVENLANANDKPYWNGNETIDPTISPDAISEDFKISITTLYFGILVGLFIVTGFLHLPEFGCLFQGFWFLLCLPSGYILLIIYSVVNITDRSWGTREDKVENTMKKDETWYTYLGKVVKQIFFCCGNQPPEYIEDRQTPPEQSGSSDTIGPRKRQPSEIGSDLEASLTKSWQGKSFSATIYETQESHEDIQNLGQEDYIYGDEEDIIKTDEWLQQIDPTLKTEYAALFKKNGYDDTSFIANMTMDDLKRLGVRKKTHRTILKNRIENLPEFRFEAAVPENVDVWLREIGLQQYKKSFTKCHIRATKDMEQLKSFGVEDIKNELGIKKPAHTRRLHNAINFLRIPTKEELLNAEIKQKLDSAIKHDIKKISMPEYEFWKLLTDTHLKPTIEAFTMIEELKTALTELRNNWLMIILAVNSLWLVLISTLASKIQLLVLGSNPVGLLFLIIFGILLLIQFLCMIFHRLSTLAHFLARAPYRFGHAYKTSWSYKTDDDIAAVAAAKRAEQICRVRERQRGQNKKKLSTHMEDETTPLRSKNTSYL